MSHQQQSHSTWQTWKTSLRTYDNNNTSVPTAQVNKLPARSSTSSSPSNPSHVSTVSSGANWKFTMKHPYNAKIQTMTEIDTHDSALSPLEHAYVAKYGKIHKGQLIIVC
jgi:hypothetical protein